MFREARTWRHPTQKPHENAVFALLVQDSQGLFVAGLELLAPRCMVALTDVFCFSAFGSFAQTQPLTFLREIRLQHKEYTIAVSQA